MFSTDELVMDFFSLNDFLTEEDRSSLKLISIFALSKTSPVTGFFENLAL